MLLKNIETNEYRKYGSHEEHLEISADGRHLIYVDEETGQDTELGVWRFVDEEYKEIPRDTTYYKETGELPSVEL